MLGKAIKEEKMSEFISEEIDSIEMERKFYSENIIKTLKKWLRIEVDEDYLDGESKIQEQKVNDKQSSTKKYKIPWLDTLLNKNNEKKEKETDAKNPWDNS